eukprot:1934048-Prymnesium_polylepis.1
MGSIVGIETAAVDVAVPRRAHGLARAQHNLLQPTRGDYTSHTHALAEKLAQSSVWALATQPKCTQAQGLVSHQPTASPPAAVASSSSCRTLQAFVAAPICASAIDCPRAVAMSTSLT